MKRFKIIIAVGVLNVIHGAVHIFQFIQSLFLTYYSFQHDEDNWVHKVMENPIMGLLWGFLGFVTLYIGWKDYKHHKEHHD